MTSDPVRLLEDPTAAAALRSDLVHATQAQLHGLDLAAGLAALQSATATVTASTTVVAGTSLLVKLGVGAGVTAGLVALWLGLQGPSPVLDEGERVAAPVLPAPPQLEPEAEMRGPGLEPRAVPKLDAEIVGAKAGAAAEGSSVAAEGSSVAAEGSSAAAESSSTAAEPRPVSSRREPRSPKAAGERPAASPADSVLREAKLVAKARSNLVRDPARALSLAQEAEADFPGGQLVEERRAIAIQALVALGRIDEATRRAEPFLAEYGRGAHAAAVRRALEGEREDP
jgi:hypothetical protein